MEPDAVSNADHTPPSRSVLGAVRSVWASLRDAYYGGIDVIERALCVH